jgi:hypothetical protein
MLRYRKRQKQSSRSVSTGLKLGIDEPGTKMSIREDNPTYKEKTNSKLRTFMKDRDMHPFYAPRENMIARLSKSTIDYESYTTEELHEMHRRRHKKTSGTKALKIERLQANDEVDHDTGGDELIRFVRLKCTGDALRMMRETEAAAARADYSSLSTGKLSDLFMQRKLPYNAQRSALLKRLEEDNKHRNKIPLCKTTQKRIKELEKKHEELVQKLTVKNWMVKITNTILHKQEFKREVRVYSPKRTASTALL